MVQADALFRLFMLPAAIPNQDADRFTTPHEQRPIEVHLANVWICRRYPALMLFLHVGHMRRSAPSVLAACTSGQAFHSLPVEAYGSGPSLFTTSHISLL